MRTGKIEKEMIGTQTNRPYRILRCVVQGETFFICEAMSDNGWSEIGDEYETFEAAFKYCEKFDLETSLDLMEIRAGCQ